MHVRKAIQRQGLWMVVSCANANQPESWTELPQLASRRLGRRQAQNTPGWRPPPPNSEALLADYDGVPQIPRILPGAYGEAPPYLSDQQVVAVALMSLSPEVSVAYFKELDSDQNQQLVWEISRLPQLGRDEREQALRYLVGPRESLEELAGRDPDQLLQRLLTLLGSGRPARLPRSLPVPEARVAYKLEGEVCDMLAARPPASVVEMLAPARMPGKKPRPSGRRFGCELTAEQLAFDLLYLPGPEEPERGRLQAQSALEASLKRWKDPKYRFLAREILQQRQEQGERALQQAPPPGHHLAEAIQGQHWLYSGEARVSIASDCVYHSVPLLRRQLPAAVHWLVVPKVSCDVFRQVELELPLDLALPGGPADLFVGSDYLACVELQPVAPGESFLLDMGVETAVRVVRNPRFQEQSTGMMGSTLQLRHEVEIEAQNYLSRQVRLQVREPLPRAREGSDCKIREDSRWEALDREGGRFCWLSLPPGQQARCQFGSTIEMSHRLELVGGNRRER
ncbi:MAG: hypothetical protein U0931_37220 [Vulcanimicrobiota bacterium]